MIVDRQWTSSEDQYSIWNYSEEEKWEKAQEEDYFFFSAPCMTKLKVQRSVEQLFREMHALFEKRLEQRLEQHFSNPRQVLGAHAWCYQPLCTRMLKKLSVDVKNPSIKALCPHRIEEVKRNLLQLADSITFLVREKDASRSPPKTLNVSSRVAQLECDERLSFGDYLDQSLKKVIGYAQTMFELIKSWFYNNGKELFKQLGVYSTPQKTRNEKEVESGKSENLERKNSSSSLSVEDQVHLASKNMGRVLPVLWKEFGNLTFLEALLQHEDVPELQQAALLSQEGQINEAQKYHGYLAGNYRDWQEKLISTGQDVDAEFFEHARSIDLISSHLVYFAPLFDEYLKSGKEAPTFKVILKDGSVADYRCTKVFNLWYGVNSCKFESLKEGAPPILSFRGTQKNMGLPGFLGSLASVLHRFGPGANIFNHKTEGMRELESWVEQQKDAVLTGHSLGGNIALDLFSRYENNFSEVLTYGSPGRNDRLLDRQFLRFDEGIQRDPEVYAKKVHQFMHARDPLAHIGASWLGNRYLVEYDHTHEPESFAEAIEIFHSRPLLLRDRLVVWKMGMQKNLIPGFQWMKFCHRFLGERLSGAMMLTVCGLDLVCSITEAAFGLAYLEGQKQAVGEFKTRWLS